MRPRVLLVGATGEFGSRLARRLARFGNTGLVVTSRDAARARCLAHKLTGDTGNAAVSAIPFTRGKDDAALFAALKPALVIDASGPFQTACYDTARAAIANGAHWIDLADADAYILGFAGALDAAARQQGVTAATGASSTPALSHAAIAELTTGWQRIDAIDLAIYPAGASRVGRAVLEAVLSYAGRPVPVWQSGAGGAVTGWGHLERVFVPDLGWRWRAPVATSDWALLSRAFSVTDRVDFYAGLESRLEQFGLRTLAQLVALGILNNPVALAPILHKARALTQIGASLTGGMTASATGLDGSGEPAAASWRLIARQGHGPNVPVLAALALARKILSPGSPQQPGARPASAHLTLAEIMAEAAPFAIATVQSATRADQSPHDRKISFEKAR